MERRRKIGIDPTYGFSLNPFMFMLVVAFAIAAPFIKDMDWSRTPAMPVLKKYYPIGLVADQTDTIYQQLPSYQLVNQDGDTLAWTRGDTLDQIRLFGIASDSVSFISRNSRVVEILDSLAKGDAIAQFLTLNMENQDGFVPIQDGVQVLDGAAELLNIIASNGLKLKWKEPTDQLDDRIVLIDRLGFTRGIYSVDELQKLQRDLNILWNGFKGI